MLVYISSTWNNIVLSSESWFGFFWVYLGLLKSGGCLLVAFHIVKIISLTSVGRAFDNLEKKIQIKSLPRFQVFILSYKSQCEKMGMTENLEK